MPGKLESYVVQVYQESQDPEYTPGEPPRISLAQSRAIWRVMREGLLGDVPDPLPIVELRELLVRTCHTHRERILTVYRLLGMLPPGSFRRLAETCGWRVDLEPYGLRPHMAILAVLFAGVPDSAFCTTGEAE